MKRILWIFLAGVVLAGFAAAPSRGNETDQFTLSPEMNFADLGDYFSQRTYATLVKVRDQTNARIGAAIAKAGGDPSRADLQEYYTPSYIAAQVARDYGLGFAESDSLERLFRSPEFAARHPGQIIAYRPSPWIYSFAHLPIDPRNAFLVARASTIKVYGFYFGTDKIGHFHQIGYSYFKRAAHADGSSPEEAAQGIIRSYAHGLISEGGLIGNAVAGVYSNADLAANYTGMKFYFNLTRPMRIKGQMQPPMLVREGAYWKLNDHIKPGAPIFAPFVSEHFNEALNPCVYSLDMRGTIAKKVRRMSADILAFYADEHGQVRSRAYFEGKVAELSTYYGESYGHSGSGRQLVTIAQMCFDGPKPIATRPLPVPKAAAAQMNLNQNVR